jgi:high-affinity iron transporter
VPERRPGVLLTALGTMLALAVGGVLLWQGVVAHGVPNPTARGLTPAAAVLDTAVLVFREGLEAILVLAAITAGLVRHDGRLGRPVAVGVALAFLASIGTWFAVVALLGAVNLPELDVQAATGLVAVLVLLLVMNWFFHNVYWTGWIGLHNEQKRRLLEGAGAPDRVAAGLILLGFSAVYREGFEVVLFLQNLRLQVGAPVVLLGAWAGIALTAAAAILTFAAHHRLPYKRMLVLTGVLLGGVLLVMVGESVQEMQQAGWLPTHALPGLHLPAWVGVWFAVFPNWEGVVAQGLAAVAVLGSYVTAEYRRVWRPRRRAAALAQQEAGAATRERAQRE